MMGKGVKATSNPWEDKNSENLVKGAEGLEWEVASPAPFHTFETPPKLNAAANKIIAI
jgi:cytochrome c oxidase subunit I